MLRIRIAALVAIAVLWFPAARLAGQTLPSGVINAPPSVIGDSESIGSHTTLNLLPGGTVGDNFQAGSFDEPSEQTIVDISGGSMGRNFVALPGSTVRLRGGVIGAGVNAFGDDFEVVGGEFRLNGMVFNGAAIGAMADGDVFTGTLQDGSPLVFSRAAFDYVSGVRLTSVELPPIDLAPILIDGSSADPPTGLRAAQSLTLQEGGTLGDSFAAVDATVAINGGVVGEGAEFSGSDVAISAGSVGAWARAHSGSEVAVTGGSVGDSFFAHSGSVVSISGGRTGRRFQADAGSVVQISGGAIGADFRGNTDVELVGGEFQLNGLPIGPGRFQFLAGNRLTGVLADGSPFVFSAVADYFTHIVLTPTAVPAADTTPQVVGAGEIATNAGLRTGQSMSVEAGGSVAEDFQVVGGSLLVSGGNVGERLEVVDGEVVLQGGTVGADAKIYSGGVMEVRQGHVESSLRVLEGGTLRVDGGSIAIGGRAIDSMVQISGGAVGGFGFYGESEVTLGGGTVGRRFRSFDEGTVELVGNDFRVNGVEIEDDTYSLPSLATLTGVLEDGAPFVFSREVGDHLGNIKLTRTEIPPVETEVVVTAAAAAVVPAGLRAGQRLTVVGDGALGDDFAAVDATLRIAGGTLGEDAEIVRTSFAMTGGAIGDGFRAFSGTTLSIGGGQIGDRFHMEGGTSLQLYGTEFYLDGVPVNGLSLGQAIEIQERNTTLTGTLLDGSDFEIDLYYWPVATRDYVDQNALVSVTLTASLGDYNADGVVDAADLSDWQSNYGRVVDPYSGADGNGDGKVDAADYGVWRDNLPAQAFSAVPEPTAGLLLSTTILVLLWRSNAAGPYWRRLVYT